MNDARAGTLLAYMKVIETGLPRVMLLENVTGFLKGGPSRIAAFDVVCAELGRINAKAGTNYQPVAFKLDAAAFGVPQRRERVFVIAERSGRRFEPPVPTHGPAASSGVRPETTSWDAIGDLDDAEWDRSLAPTGAWAELLPSIPEGQNYLFHTARGGGEPIFGWRTKYWSFLLKLAKNRPSWTIQASPGPATGPFHWRNRKLSVLELARLQTFPESVRFAGSYRSAHKQIGNAVPSLLGEVLGREIKRQLLGTTVPGEPELCIRPRDDRPDPEPIRDVPQRFFRLYGVHDPHPGAGRGPGALRDLA